MPLINDDFLRIFMFLIFEDSERGKDELKMVRWELHVYRVLQ